MAGGANGGGWPRWSTVLPPVVGDAARAEGRDAKFSLLLQARGRASSPAAIVAWRSSSTPAMAPLHGRRCCKGSGSLLRRRLGGAAMVDDDCYNGVAAIATAARVICCKGAWRPTSLVLNAASPELDRPWRGRDSGTTCAR